MDESTGPTLVTREPRHCVVVRQRVPMSDLGPFFGRVFEVTMAAAAAQGRQVVGPPFAAYLGMPSDTVDVAAGFPVDAEIQPDGEVTSMELPGGQLVELLHVGSYDSLPEGYDVLMRWMREQNLTPGGPMWESYLNEPRPDAPDEAQTLITWPVG